MATPVAAPHRGGEVRLARPSGRTSNFNPSAFAQDLQIPWSYLEPLVRPDPVTLAPTPWLAERWEWDAAGLELTLTLRDGVRWHDGTPFDANDAVFAYGVYQRDLDSAVSGLFELVASVEATSNRTLIVRFAERDGAWLFNAATLPIFSRMQYEAYWTSLPEGGRTLSQFDWSASTPIGTGPWRVEEWDDRRVAFTRFDDYWNEPAWLDRYTLTIEDGIQRRLEAWETGEVQLLWPVSAQAAARVAEAPEEVVAAPAASVMFAAFNFANPNQPNGSLWTDPQVRRAAAMAIDRDRYAREVFGGHIQALAAGTVAQPWAHDDSVASPAVDRDAASIILGEAGWLDYDGDGIREDANGVPLQPVAIVRDDMPAELIEVLARVARDLVEVGIGMTVEVLPPEEFESRWIASRDYDLIAYAYDLLPGFTDYDLYGSAWDIRTNPAGWNPGGYSNPEADAAIADYLAAVSLSRQKAALATLQQAVNDDLFGLWFGFPDDLILVARGVEGFEPDVAWQTAQTWKLWLA
jgi:ABC-type transport system substrate-binding protein